MTAPVRADLLSFELHSLFIGRLLLAEAGEVPDFVTRSEVEMSERKERWFCSLLRALAVLRNDADAAFQSGAAKALYDIQVR